MSGRDARSALVLFSGGQDSAVCLAHALDAYAHVETVGFDYGQRHRVELDCREPLRRGVCACVADGASRLGADHLLPLPALAAIGGTPLIAGPPGAGAESDGVIDASPAFVPGRNILFLAYAAALAFGRRLDVLVGGMCETDFSGYPDCRREFVDAMEKAVAHGMGRRIAILTPLMHLDKAEIWEAARRLGGDALTEVIAEQSHTCYRGVRSARRPWGYGCGECAACLLRARGYARWRDSWVTR